MRPQQKNVFIKRKVELFALNCAMCIEALLLYLGRLWVFLVIDEVLGEGVGHELLGLVLHIGGDK